MDIARTTAALRGAPRVRAAAVLHAGGELVAYVVPGHNTAAVSAWRDAFREIYKEPAAPDGFDARGWVSSIDGKPLAEQDMRAWRDTTVARLLAAPPGRVLEVGCGNGLLATELIGPCAAYTGTDIVAEGLPSLRTRLQPLGPGKATLVRAEATDLHTLPGEYDLIVLNSVIQYFPDARYLLDVLDQAVAKLSPGGRLFVGDVRHSGLAERLYVERAYARLAEPTPEKVARLVRVSSTAEGELLADPRFFVAYAHRLGPDWYADVEPKRGRYDNELSRYRFDATLGRTPVPGAAPVVRSFGDLPRLLAGHVSPIVLRDLPNARLGSGGVHPEDVYELGAAHGYTVRLDWTGGGPEFDAYLSRDGRVAPLRLPPDGTPASHVSAPRLGGANERHAAEVLAHLGEVLPADLMPARIEIVDTLPT
ncbi:class I SAM-dependent methyltransferase [Hamadaea tsunoensis]|uniref:class I SAM-dependent methyltransferase n=1 Tax=Hamadaea tsunoensis TaxID=53368 RepID=UPI0003F63080|nr:class I SAM-dependent methyltransferase [Hamadaea tsunoensis]